MKAVHNKTPFEAWHKKKPIVDHFKVFGCITYSHISTPNNDKFDEKGENLIFIGYSDESKGYRLFNLATNKLVVSRDVIFDEATAWNWSENSSQPTSKFLKPITVEEQ